MKNRTVYSLDVNDIQGVAEKTLGRSLTEFEIGKVTDNVSDFIPWFDAIDNAINSALEK